jgi:SAM-dependent methyltransferase
MLNHPARFSPGGSAKYMTETLGQVEQEGQRRLNPSLANPNYLVLRRRRIQFAAWIAVVPGNQLRVLDAGGRIQPYRPLLEGRLIEYVAVDIADSPLVNVKADICHMPFSTGSFDLAICTQVLDLLPDPSVAVAEIHRVLKPGGVALFSLPACALRFNDAERWRFLPAGIRQLLAPFRQAEIVAEGTSISGFFRNLNLALCMFARFTWLRTLVTWTAVPLFNCTALALEAVAQTANDQGAGNYSVRALK